MELDAIRNIVRINQIARALIKYGFGGLVSELGIAPVLSKIAKVFPFARVSKELTTQQRVRLILEELGPTFVKLGQVVSTRADLFPKEWIDELKKLQDSVPSEDFSDIRKVMEKSFRSPVSSVFKTFDEVPIASASIAQVHYATLLDGTEVAVKVKRPGIEGTIDADLSVMYTIANLLKRHVREARRYRPIDVVDEFARVIHNELDLTIEGANATIFARIFKDDPDVKIPKVYWSYTTKDVLTMERISGVPLDETDKIKEMGLDVKKIAANGVKAFFKQVFDHGIFHADLHPGNIFAGKNGEIIYLDFGIVGRLDRDLRSYMASMLYHTVRQDYRKLAILHREMGLIDKDVDIHEFEHALMDIAEPVFGRTLEEIDMSSLVMKLIQTARRFKMRLQPNLLLLQKSMVIIEGVGRQLYPNVNMWEVAKPLITRWMIKQKFSPGVHLERGSEFAGELGATILDLPAQMHSLFRTAVKDELKIGFVHHRLDELTDEVRGAGKSIAGGFVTASLVIIGGTGAVFMPSTSAGLWGLPYISIISFAAAIVSSYLTFSKKRRVNYDD